MKEPLVAREDAERRYPHGSNARYTFGRCRCEQCTAARAQAVRDRTRDKLEAAPWAVSRAGKSRADGTKTVRVRNRLTGEVVLRTTDESLAKRRVTALNRRDGAADALGGMMVSTAPARKRIAELRALGIGPNTIADRAGISRSVLWRIVGHRTGYRTIRQTRRDVVDAILGVPRDALAAGARVGDPSEAYARLDALVANGFARSFIASLVIGRKVAALQLGRKRGTITAGHARKVRDLYERLRDVRPTAYMTRHGPRPWHAGLKKGGVLTVAEARALGLSLGAQASSR